MHFYNQNGAPVYEVPYADPAKGKRKATLRDAKKMSLVPGVTEIIAIMAKPGLERWKQQQVLEASLTLPRGDNEADAAYMKRIFVDSQELGKIAAEKGVDIHKAIEYRFAERVVSHEYRELAGTVHQAINEHFATDVWDWDAEKSFAHRLGFGGCVDISTDIVVIDIKTKEKFSKKMAFDEHAMQLAAYAHGLNIKKPTCANVFVSWAGEIIIHEWSTEDIERGWEMFGQCLQLWQLTKRYDSKFEPIILGHGRS